MSNDENDKLLDHEYDGIQELDNNLPLWWLWTFFGAIIFSFIYWIHYSFTEDGPNLDQELQAAMTQIEQQRKSAEASDQSPEAQSPELVIASGKKIYQSYCASCHLENGGGSIGPNLTDDYWIHGHTTDAITLVIKTGILDKGMPAWEEVLRPHEIKSLVSFVESLKGLNVADGKAPQGDKISQ